MGSLDKRPHSFRTQYTENGESSGFSKAHKHHHAGSIQLEELGPSENSCVSSLPALYSPQEPVRYLAPTGYT